MQKNWHVVYTKPQCEKKLASLFSKWKIENFYPVNSVKSSTAWRSKMVCEPLFKSYLFVYISEDQITKLCRVEGVVSFLYWLGKPAIIKNEEIEIIKEFINDYQDISVQRGIVNMEGLVKIIDDPSYKMEGKFISIKSKTIKVHLPSLGFTLIAVPQKETILDKQNSLLESVTVKVSHTEVNTA